MRILGLESSCDETAVAIFDSNQFKVCYDQILTQIDIHKEYGGVVPGIATREHLKGFHVLLEKLNKEIDLCTINAICVTVGPGLIGCLGIGVAYAQSLKLLLNIPIYGINHLQAHALSPFICSDKTINNETLFPHLGLLVSGGNTLLFEIENNLSFKTLAQTVDDAAGEAFDKGAKLLGLQYPGGHLIEKLAQNGDINFVKFPRAFREKTALKFSFSGLKTSLRYFLDKLSTEEIEEKKCSICASYQEAIVDILSTKTVQMLEQKQFKSLGISGGVSINDTLRSRLKCIADKFKIPFLAPKKRYCGDNGAMIAFAGYNLHKFEINDTKCVLTKKLNVDSYKSFDENSDNVEFSHNNNDFLKKSIEPIPTLTLDEIV